LPTPPWQLTLRQFLEKIQRDYGTAREDLGFPVAGSWSPVVLDYLERTNLADALALVVELDEDEILTPTILRHLCNLLSLPPEDFHLDSED
jgi:hypothetical protein